ncbi:MAG: hypothetical protein WAU00_22285 [Caldilinea sp.]
MEYWHWPLGNGRFYGLRIHSDLLTRLCSRPRSLIAAYNVSPHFEARLAHVHGNLFSFLNIVFGFLLVKLPVKTIQARWISGLALAGLLMPIGILSEIYLGLPPLLVLIGGLSILAATILLGIGVVEMKLQSV